MLALQILIDGFAVSALYGLDAVGFTLMSGVSGVLNLAHGSTLLVAAVVAWLLADRVGAYGGAAAGLLAGIAMAFATYLLVVRPIQRSKAIPSEEKEIFVLTGTLLWGIMMRRPPPIPPPQPAHRPPPDCRRGRGRRGADADQRDPHGGAVLGRHRAAVAAGQPHPGRQGAAGGVHQPARPDLAWVRAAAHLLAGLGDLRRPGRHCRGAARRVSGHVVRRARRSCWMWRT